MPPRTCEIEGCENKHHAKGLCRKQYNRRYKQENREEVREYNHKWRAENPGYSREYYATNPEKCREWSREWEKAHPERGRKRSRKRRARKKSQLGLWHHLESQIEQLLYRSQAGCCFYCGELLDWEDRRKSPLEHMTPLSRGGAHGIDNWCLACQPCNQRKGIKTPEEFQNG